MTLLIDIEDIGKNHSPSDRDNSSDVVVARIKPIKKSTEEIDAESFIPGRQSIYVETWGCSHNSSDSEYMAGLLSKYGFTVHMQGSRAENTTESCEIVNKKSGKEDIRKLEADLWLLNSCTVKNPAEDHFRNMIEEARKRGKMVVVAGCVPQGQPKAGYLQGVSVVGVQQIDRVVEVVEETLKGNSVQLYAKKREHGKRMGGASLSLPKIRRNPLIEILAVNTGCLNACTYCKTKHARGDLGSYPIEEVVARAREAYGEGCREVWLTSEDLGAYGIDRGASLPALLEALVPVIPRGCMLRLGMTNPPYVRQHVARVAAVLMHPRVYSFIHIPVQSGSNNVLGEMKREYTREEFCEVVDTLYSSLGGPQSLTIATDVICGFPTETEADFEETFSLLARYRFPVLFSNQYFARPGTVAARMRREATTREVKQRTKRVHELTRSWAVYGDARVGEEVRVLVCEESGDGLWLVGHTKRYEQVVVAREAGRMGRCWLARVVSVSRHCMVAEVLREVDDVSEDCEASAVGVGEERTAVSRTEPRAALSSAALSRVFGVLCLALVLFRLYSALVARLF